MDIWLLSCYRNYWLVRDLNICIYGLWQVVLSNFLTSWWCNFMCVLWCCIIFLTSEYMWYSLCALSQFYLVPRKLCVSSCILLEIVLMSLRILARKMLCSSPILGNLSITSLQLHWRFLQGSVVFPCTEKCIGGAQYLEIVIVMFLFLCSQNINLVRVQSFFLEDPRFSLRLSFFSPSWSYASERSYSVVN